MYGRTEVADNFVQTNQKRRKAANRFFREATIFQFKRCSAQPTSILTGRVQKEELGAPPNRESMWIRRKCATSGGLAMGEVGIGWIAAIIVGGIAGWLAEQFMKSNMGLLMNIVLGIIGAAVASAILSFFGIALGGWIGYLICGFIGAVLLIAIVRAVRPA